jgi:hypothetical protein
MKTLVHKRTAILIVHGVGQQAKYDTVSAFAAGLAGRLRSVTGQPIQSTRRLRAFSNGIDSLLRLTPAAASDDTVIDIVEYYYQPILQRRALLADVVEWLMRTSDHIRALYRNTPALRQRLDGDTTLGRNYMLYQTALVVPVLVWVWRGVRLLQRIPGAGAYLEWPTAVMEWLVGKLLDKLIIEFAADVTAYTAIDARERLHDVRKQILSGCTLVLRELLKGTGPDAYDQVILAGHSLGSVVGYDAASRLSAEAEARPSAFTDDELRRLVGFVTFGSPLDKVAMCFWPFEPDAVADGDGVRAAWLQQRSAIRQLMLEHFHGMRGLSPRLTGAAAAEAAAAVEQRPLGHVVWLNFFHPKDVIAGSLDAYRGVTNIRTYANEGMPEHVARDQKFPGAHGYYWYDPTMHDAIIDAFLTDDTACYIADAARFTAKLEALRARSMPWPRPADDTGA